MVTANHPDDIYESGLARGTWQDRRYLSTQAVGFDMDYTLSQYKPETFEKLAHDLTVEKLVGVFGYPEVNDCQSKLCLLQLGHILHHQ